MASRTPNLNLIKPALSDNVTPAQFNENSDVLDVVITELQEALDQAEADIKQLQPGSIAPAIIARETRKWLDEHGVSGAVRIDEAEHAIYVE